MNIIHRYLSCCFKSNNLIQVQSTPKNSNISIHKKIELIILDIPNHATLLFNIIFFSRYRNCFFTMTGNGFLIICKLRRMDQFKDYNNIILYRIYYGKNTRLYTNHLGIIGNVYKVDIEAIL